MTIQHGVKRCTGELQCGQHSIAHLTHLDFKQRVEGAGQVHGRKHL